MSLDTAPTDLPALAARLPLVCLKLHFQSRTEWLHAESAGAVLRGTLGACLLQQACLEQERDCPPCRNPQLCAFGRLFETVRLDQSPRLGAQETLPHPMVLGVQIGKSPSQLEVEIGVFGHTAAALTEHLVQAAVQALDRGLGPQRKRGVLKSVEAWSMAKASWLPVVKAPAAESMTWEPAQFSSLHLSLLSPLRLLHEGTLIGPDRLQASDVLRALLRRISLLVSFYGRPGSEPDFKHWAQLAKQVVIDDRRDLRRLRQRRYSARQKRTLPLDGLIGTMRLGGSHLDDWLPLLMLGRFTGIGKGTVHGLGRYMLSLA